MKLYRLMLIGLVSSIVMSAVHAAESSYPWYQAYKDPAVKQRVSRGLQSAKEFVVRNKAKIITAAVLAAIAAVLLE
jgi:hypothetical protein